MYPHDKVATHALRLRAARARLRALRCARRCAATKVLAFCAHEHSRWMAVVVGAPCDWRETAMLQAAMAGMDNLLMGAAAMSNLLMSTTRATSSLRHTASTSTSSS